jgi:hypothetical protein
MTRTVRAVMALLLASLVVASVPAVAGAATYSRAQKTERANVIYGKSLAAFIRLKGGKHTGIDTSFYWKDDGCTTPDIPGTGTYNKKFLQACQRHDFGYRNFGNGYAAGRALTSTDAKKRAIDNRFLEDMKGKCGDSSSCKAAANAYYKLMSASGKSQTAFYKGECHENRLCLFDDDGFKDRRIALTSSENNMKDVSFGDKTSSVKNETKVAWVLYDDDNYDDRSICVRPGTSVSNLDTKSFGDKTSSAKRLSSASCP